MEDKILTATNNPTRTIPVYVAGVRTGERLNSGDTIERQRREGLEWRFTGLDDWPTERIFDTFGALGIAVDESRFRELALQYRSMEDLATTWDPHFREEDLWSDFPFLAIKALWPRIAPDVATPETIADVLEACEALLDGPNRDIETIKSQITLFTDYLTSFSDSEIPKQ